MSSILGNNIRALRKARNWSQATFAEHFEITRASVGSYEEHRAEPKLELLLRIAKTFSVSLDSLIGAPIESVDSSIRVKENTLENQSNGKNSQDLFYPEKSHSTSLTSSRSQNATTGTWITIHASTERKDEKWKNGMQLLLEPLSEGFDYFGIFYIEYLHKALIVEGEFIWDKQAISASRIVEIRCTPQDLR